MPAKDQNLLLTAEKLTLSPDIQKGWMEHQTMVWKNVPRQTYLAISQAQAVVLESFGQPCTVPDALARNLRERSCLPLREFYELVLKAYRAGILVSGSSRKSPKKALRWPALKAADLVTGPSLILVILCFVLLAGRSPQFRPDWLALGAGLGCALVALSLGQALAASILAGFGCEVYARKPTASWLRLHLRLDLSDSRLLPPWEQVLIAMAVNLPLAIALFVALCGCPSAVPALALVWLLLWRPWGTGLPRALAALLSRYPHKDTDSGFLFLPNQRPQLHWRPWWQRWDWRVCALELVWAAIWSLLVAQVTFHGLGIPFMTVAGNRELWMIALPILGAALLITIVVIMVNRWRHGLRQVWRTAQQRLSAAWKHWRQEYVFPDTEPALLRIAAAHPLLGQLNPYDQAQLVRAWRPVVFKCWRRLCPTGQESDHVGLILSGRAAVNRIGKHGGRGYALKLWEGGVFGVPPLRSSAEMILEVKSRTPVAALMMPTAVFKNVVIARLGEEVVYDLTHKYAFLQQLRLCASWHAHAVARFARLAQITVYGDGDEVLREKSDTRWFYIIYEGVAQVRRGGKLLSRLNTGEFFGEISLLQNSSANADVVAQGQLRCLQIDRASFLRFMTHNHHVALELERISSARLGRPIFPLHPLSFEVNGR